MCADRFLHVVVSYAEYDIPIPHREQRLANFLSEKNSTKKVLWVYAKENPDNPWHIEHINESILQIPIYNRPYRSFNDKPVIKRHYSNKLEDEISRFSTDKKILWYTKPTLSNLTKLNWDSIIYDCSDHHTSIGWETRSELGLFGFSRKKISAWLTHWSEVNILNDADHVFASSEFLYDKFRRQINPEKIQLVETGIDFELFKKTTSTHEQIEEIPRPRLGFTGKMKKKIDYELMSRVAANNPEWNLVLIGPDSGTSQKDSFQQLIQMDNVFWLDYIPHEKIASAIRSFDVGIMPYKDIEYNRGVVPLKFYEYLACGLPVVGCGLPSTTSYTRDGIYIHTLNKQHEFSKACKEALSWQEGKQDRIAIAEEADWESKFEFIYDQVMKACE